MKNKSLWRVGTAWAVACAVLPLACSAPRENLLPKAEQLVLDGKWYEAIPVLKRQLVMHPDDAGAHYYLGRCYMLVNDEDFYPRLAEGELQTAIRMFKRAGGETSPIERFDPKYFEMICLVDSSKVFVRQMTLFLRDGGRLVPMKHFIERARHYAERAAGVMPEAPEVSETMRIVEEFERQWRATPEGAAEYSQPTAGSTVER